VKRSDRVEPICVVIHMCMEAMLEISPYSYLYLKLAKLILIISYVFSSTKSEDKRAEQVLPGGEEAGGGRWPKQCIHMSKCKNYNIKKKIEVTQRKKENPGKTDFRK
jgi:hypothetical protein